MELSEAEAFGVVDDHEVGVGDIDADFDDGGGDEGFEGSVAKIFHDGFFFLGAEFSVDEADVFGAESFLPFGEGIDGGLGVEGFRFIDEGVDEVCLAALGELGFYEVGDVGLFWFLTEGGDDGAAS